MTSRTKFFMTTFKIVSRVWKFEFLKKDGNFCIASWIMKKHFFHGGKKRCFLPCFHCKIIFCCAELFDCAFNFIFLEHFYIFKQHKTNIKGARFEFYTKQPLILGVTVERCSGGICLDVNCQASNFMGVFEDFGHTFLTCSKKNILKF